MFPFPPSAGPHEVAILHVYLTVSPKPQEIKQFLHYRSISPIYEAINKHRQFLAEHRRHTASTVLFA